MPKYFGIRFQTFNLKGVLPDLQIGHWRSSVPTNYHQKETIDIYTYRLANMTSLYNDQGALNNSKWAKRLQAQMKISVFKLFDRISIMLFGSSFNLPCETNVVHDYAAMQLLRFFMKNQVAAVLNLRSALKFKSLRWGQKNGALTKYCDVVSSLLASFGTDEVIAETDDEIMKVSQLLNKTQIEFAELLLAKTLRRD